MDPRDLYDDLWLSGLRLSTTPDGKLSVSPAGQMTPEQRALVKAHWVELAVLAATEEQVRADRAKDIERVNNANK